MRAFVAIRMSAQVEDSVASAIEELKRPRDGDASFELLGTAFDGHRFRRHGFGAREHHRLRIECRDIFGNLQNVANRRAAGSR